ncbi:hypothetical protein CDAR_369451 [Caerostris darwini]|uniref:Uncharacterized protein n=1 Tax=Caerostris darwini TaxID=1538125 RepID=A0AAV4S296_9ARAC|nr:hypothetical protein CDAR_369451 [Caerostris darwini]
MSGNDGFHVWGACPETFRKMQSTDPGWETLSRSLEGWGAGHVREVGRVQERVDGLRSRSQFPVGVLNPRAEPPLLAEEFVGFRETEVPDTWKLRKWLAYFISIGELMCLGEWKVG